MKSCGAEQIVHTRWPTEVFVHGCVDVTPMSTPFARIHMRSCQTPMALFPGFVVSWALLLQSFRAEQIVHIRWPTEVFVHACVDVTPMSTPFARIHICSCQTPMELLPALVVCWALLLQSFIAERIVHTR